MPVASVTRKECPGTLGELEREILRPILEELPAEDAVVVRVERFLAGFLAVDPGDDGFLAGERLAVGIRRTAVTWRGTPDFAYLSTTMLTTCFGSLMARKTSTSPLTNASLDSASWMVSRNAPVSPWANEIATTVSVSSRFAL